MVAADPDAGRRWALSHPVDGSSPPSGRPVRHPAQCRPSCSAVAAAADSPDLTASGIPGLSASALAPAEAAGLIRLDAAGPQFTHPLVRSAVYHDAPFAERAAAHLAIADTLRDQPDRYAWHLAAAALEPDERVALLLEETATQAAAAAAPPQRHVPWSEPPSSARVSETEPGGCWLLPILPFPQDRLTGYASWPGRSSR